MKTVLALAVWGLTLGFAPATASAAPRARYGGELRFFERSGPPVLVGCPAHTVSGWLAAQSVLEPLLRPSADGVRPVLARELPRLQAGLLVVPIARERFDHDGKAVDAPAVAEWLRRVRDDPRGCWPIARWLRDLGPGTIKADPLTNEVRIRWPHRRNVALWLLADPALRWFRPTETGVVGTGPFRTGAPGNRTRQLTAFERHVEGRPFLDAIVMRWSQGRYARPPADTDCVVEARGDGPNLRLLWMLVVGPEVRRDHPSLADQIDGALERRRLVDRFVNGEMKARRSFADRSPQRLAPPDARRPRRRLTLAVPASFPGPFVERLQLDLLEAGIRVFVDRITASDLDRIRVQGRFDLMLQPIVTAAERPERNLWRLVELFATPASDPTFMDPQLELDAAVLEDRLFSSLGIVPIAEASVGCPDDALDLTRLADHHLGLLR